MIIYIPLIRRYLRKTPEIDIIVSKMINYLNKYRLKFKISKSQVHFYIKEKFNLKYLNKLIVNSLSNI